MVKALHILLIFPLLVLLGCSEMENKSPDSQRSGQSTTKAFPDEPYIVVLGTAQDAGYPQAGCTKSCCAEAWDAPSLHRSPTSIALVSPATQQKWLFEATPDLPQQLSRLNKHVDSGNGHHPDGIFLTHAHIGHYAGLMYFGHEVQGASGVPVYAMPRMGDFLQKNGPWSQLVEFENITLKPLKSDSAMVLADSIAVTPFLVPHRDEFSETVGYRIQVGLRAALFIPDINKWHLWERDLATEISKVDLAFLDATFFKAGELPGRNMEEIPHPFVQETMELLKALPATEKSKVKFIHFNHTNPLIWDADAAEEVHAAGFEIAVEGKTYGF